MAVRIVPLGGLGEVGLNAMVVEEEGRRVLVDAGVLFANDRVPGAEVAIPDFSYLREAGGLDAVVLTHGHEDHVGALPALLAEFPVPVYGTRFTLGLVKERLAEHGLSVPLHEVTPRVPFEAGPFIAEPLRVAHSIPDGVGYAFETGEGVVIHTGDWKMDLTPLDGERLDLTRFSELGKAGVAALMSDSTNAERDGFSISESAVFDAFYKRFRSAPGRIFVALFASNVPRIQGILQIAAALGRKVVLAGRSLQRNVALARDLGLVKVPPDTLVEPEQAASLPAAKVVVVCSGAQGEPLSALSRLAAGEGKPLVIEPRDLVLFSSRSIPGNEAAINDLANRLARRGADVVDRALDPIHASGHAQRDEQKILIDAVRPRHFVPIHGDWRMLMAHGRTALAMGLAASEVFVIENGETVVLNGGRMGQGDSVPVGRVWLDGRAGPVVPEERLKERTRMSERGAVAALLVVDGESGRFVRGPELTARGVPEFGVGRPLHDECSRLVREALSELPEVSRPSVAQLEEALVRGVRRAFKRETGGRPEVLPLVVTV
jgi:ribonuclease J